MNICLFSESEINSPLPIKDERAQHLVKILHKKEGESFSAGIIGGKAGKAVITKITEKDISFSFSPETDGKPLHPLIMIIGFPRPIQLKRLLRDIAALGCMEVHLTGTELGEKSYLNSNLSSPEAAWEMLLDGTVQAASTHVPEVFVHKNLSECLKNVNERMENIISSLGSENSQEETDYPTKTLKLCLDNINPSSSLKKALEQNVKNSKSQPIYVSAIGSERGWTDNERKILEKDGFLRCGMGNRVMRTETACTVAASIISAWADWLE